MDIEIEPARFQKMLANVLLHKQGAALDANIASFTTKGVVFKDISLGVVIINAVYSKDYFFKYGFETSEKVPFSKTLLEEMKHGFRDEKMRAFTEGDKIVIQGKIDRYEENLPDIKPVEVEAEYRIDRKVGIVPKNPKVLAQIQTDADIIKSVARSEAVTFKCDSNKIIAFVEGVGVFSKEIVPSDKTDELTEFDMAFSAKLLGDMAAQFSDKIWLTFTLNEEGNTGVTFSQRGKDFLLSYSLSSR